MLPQRPFSDGLDGNFTAYIPRQLTTFDLRFPAASRRRSVSQAGSITPATRPGLTTPEVRQFVAEYRPRFETFIHAGSCRKLTYTWAAGGQFHVDVLHNRETGEWNVYKFSAGRLVRHACGQGFGEAMINASGIGLDAAEPAFTFAGDPEECRCENLVQAEWANESESERVSGPEPGEKGACKPWFLAQCPLLSAATTWFLCPWRRPGNSRPFVTRWRRRPGANSS